MLLHDARDTLRPESLNRRKNAFAMRMPLIAPISLISLLYALSLFVFYQNGFIAGTTFAGVASIALICIVLFYGLFRFNFNARFAEPTLMLPQLVFTLTIMFTVAWIERATQLALAPFVLIAFSFGIFRLSTMHLTVLAASCLGIYLGIVLLHGQAEHWNHFHADLVQWCVLALTLPSMILVGKQIQQLRRLLRSTRYQLEHYEEKSVRDELTGLYNRRRIHAELEEAKLQTQTRLTPFSICLIDIDRFKEINDRNGHLAGDTVLKEFSRLARHSIRDTDVLGRYGGDEFLLILPDADVKGAVLHAERLRIHAHFLDFQKVLEQKNITLSIGVAQYRCGEKITDLIARADTALYQAKQRGRNCVEWVEEPR